MIHIKNITINIPNEYDDNIKKLIKAKIVDSRSKAIREAVKSFIVKETEFRKKLKSFTPKMTPKLEQHQQEIIEKQIKEQQKRQQVFKRVFPEKVNTEKPEKLYRIFKNSIYCDYIVSFLKQERRALDGCILSNMLDLSEVYVYNILSKIRKIYPNLIKKIKYEKKVNGHFFRYQLNEQRFNEILKEVEKPLK